MLNIIHMVWIYKISHNIDLLFSLLFFFEFLLKVFSFFNTIPYFGGLLSISYYKIKHNYIISNQTEIECGYISLLHVFGTAFWYLSSSCFSISHIFYNNLVIIQATILLLSAETYFISQYSCTIHVHFFTDFSSKYLRTWLSVCLRL